MLTALLRLYPHVRSLIPRAVRARLVARFSDIRARLIGRYAPAVLTVGYNGALLVSARDAVLGWCLAEHGSYDQERIEFLKARIRPSSDVLIVGAHVGALLVPLAKVVRQVVGIEPNPETFRLLELNVRLNALDNAEICNFAAGDSSGEVDFLTCEVNSGASRLSFSHVEDRTGWDATSWAPRAPSKVRVPMRVLDEVFPSRTFDLVVMDIEGAEFVALRGMREILARARTLQVEILPLYTKKVARVQIGEAVELLGAGFDSAIFFSKYCRSSVFSSGQFDRLASEIERGGGGDVIFMRDNTNAAAA